MATLNEIYIKKEALEIMLRACNTRNQSGISITLSVSDKTNSYNQNCSAFVSQSKEDREAKKSKYYIGNGRTVWSDGVATSAVAYKDASTAQAPQVEQSNDDDLPF